MKAGAALALVGIAVVVARSAGAQEPTAGAPPAAPAAPAPAAAPAAAKDAPAEGDDHMGVVNHFAVGYFGLSQLPIAGPGSGTGGAVRDVVNAPVVGVRYWFNERIGIDGGLGFGLQAGSTEVVNGANDVSADKPNKWGLGFHAGVPLAFAHATHYVFEIVPEANVGFTSGSIKGGPGVPDQSLSGFRLDLGARVGAEVHFGFIGIPQLALQASIGLYFRREAFKWSQAGNSASDGSTFVATSVQADPWAIFADNISALYYF